MGMETVARKERDKKMAGIARRKERPTRVETAHQKRRGVESDPGRDGWGTIEGVKDGNGCRTGAGTVPAPAHLGLCTHGWRAGGGCGSARPRGAGRRGQAHRPVLASSWRCAAQRSLLQPAQPATGEVLVPGGSAPAPRPGVGKLAPGCG